MVHALITCLKEQKRLHQAADAAAAASVSSGGVGAAADGAGMTAAQAALINTAVTTLEGLDDGVSFTVIECGSAGGSSDSKGSGSGAGGAAGAHLNPAFFSSAKAYLISAATLMERTAWVESLAYNARLCSPEGHTSGGMALLTQIRRYLQQAPGAGAGGKDGPVIGGPVLLQASNNASTSAAAGAAAGGYSISGPVAGAVPMTGAVAAGAGAMDSAMAAFYAEDPLMQLLRFPGAATGGAPAIPLRPLAAAADAAAGTAGTGAITGATTGAAAGSAGSASLLATSAGGMTGVSSVAGDSASARGSFGQESDAGPGSGSNSAAGGSPVLGATAAISGGADASGAGASSGVAVGNSRRTVASVDSNFSSVLPVALSRNSSVRDKSAFSGGANSAEPDVEARRAILSSLMNPHHSATGNRRSVSFGDRSTGSHASHRLSARLPLDPEHLHLPLPHQHLHPPSSGDSSRRLSVPRTSAGAPASGSPLLGLHSGEHGQSGHHSHHHHHTVHPHAHYLKLLELLLWCRDGVSSAQQNPLGAPTTASSLMAYPNRTEHGKSLLQALSPAVLNTLPRVFARLGIPWKNGAPSVDIRLPPPHARHLPPSLRIFTGTWNMAECLPPGDMPARLFPRGCDVYAIGFQECMHLDAALREIRKFLGPAYLEVSHRLGSTSKAFGFHGYIAVSVFAHEWMVESGVCKVSKATRGAVALGRNLVVTRASNKGACGIALPIRLPGPNGHLTVASSLVFISCHLQNDVKGASRLSERNKNAKDLLDAFGLNLSQPAIDRAVSHAKQMAEYVKSREDSAMAAAALASELSGEKFEASADEETHSIVADDDEEEDVSVIEEEDLMQGDESSPITGGLSKVQSTATISSAKSPSGTPSRTPVPSLPADAAKTNNLKIGTPSSGTSTSASGALSPALNMSRLFPRLSASLSGEVGGNDTDTPGGADGAKLGVSASKAYVYILGDLNYRVSGINATDCVTSIVKTSFQERIRGPLKSPQYDAHAPAAFPIYLEGDERAWDAVTDFDELKTMLKNGSAFPGFVEPPVAFPPSYRIRRQERSALIRVRGDFADKTSVFEGYSLVKMKGKEKAASKLIEMERKRSAVESVPRRQDAADKQRRHTFADNRNSVKKPLKPLGDGIKDLGTIGESSQDASAPSDEEDEEDDFDDDFALERNPDEVRRHSLAATVASAISDGDPKHVRIPSYTDRCLLRTPLLAGLPVFTSTFEKELTRRRTARFSRSQLAAALKRESKNAASSLGLAISPAGAHGSVSARTMDLMEPSEEMGSVDTFVPLPSVRCIYYDCNDTVAGSDHMAVAAVWEMPLLMFPQSGPLDSNAQVEDFIAVTDPFPFALRESMFPRIFPSSLGSLAQQSILPAAIATDPTIRSISNAVLGKVDVQLSSTPSSSDPGARLAEASASSLVSASEQGALPAGLVQAPSTLASSEHGRTVAVFSDVESDVSDVASVPGETVTGIDELAIGIDDDGASSQSEGEDKKGFSPSMFPGPTGTFGGNANTHRARANTGARAIDPAAAISKAAYRMSTAFNAKVLATHWDGGAGRNTRANTGIVASALTPTEKDHTPMGSPVVTGAEVAFPITIANEKKPAVPAATAGAPSASAARPPPPRGPPSGAGAAAPPPGAAGKKTPQALYSNIGPLAAGARTCHAWPADLSSATITMDPLQLALVTAQAAGEAEELTNREAHLLAAALVGETPQQSHDRRRKDIEALYGLPAYRYPWRGGALSADMEADDAKSPEATDAKCAPGLRLAKPPADGTMFAPALPSTVGPTHPLDWPQHLLDPALAEVLQRQINLAFVQQAMQSRVALSSLGLRESMNGSLSAMVARYQQNSDFASASGGAPNVPLLWGAWGNRPRQRALAAASLSSIMTIQTGGYSVRGSVMSLRGSHPPGGHGSIMHAAPPAGVRESAAKAPSATTAPVVPSAAHASHPLMHNGRGSGSRSIVPTAAASTVPGTRLSVKWPPGPVATSLEPAGAAPSGHSKTVPLPPNRQSLSAPISALAGTRNSIRGTQGHAPETKQA
jgi:hypothetical protein